MKDFTVISFGSLNTRPSLLQDFYFTLLCNHPLRHITRKKMKINIKPKSKWLRKCSRQQIDINKMLAGLI